jgi:hypothetical protein
MRHTLAIFFSKLRNQSSESRLLHGSLEDSALPAGNPGHQTLAPIQISERVLHLIAVREPPPFLETLSLIQGPSSSSSDEVKRREQEKQSMQILAGEAPAQLRKRKSVDDEYKGACRPPAGVRSGAGPVCAHLPSEPDGARDGFWKDVQAKRQRRIENSSPLSRQRQGGQAKGARTPTSARGPNAQNSSQESSLRPARQTPFGFAAKKTK